MAIEDAQFRPPLGSTGIGVAYFTIRSDKDNRIVAVSSPAADSIEIHASVTEGGNVSMQRLEGVDLPAGKTVKFESGGMQDLLMKMQPDRLEDLIAANALYRPGPMELIPLYCARKHGRERVPSEQLKLVIDSYHRMYMAFMYSGCSSRKSSTASSAAMNAARPVRPPTKRSSSSTHLWLKNLTRLPNRASFEPNR